MTLPQEFISLMQEQLGSEEASELFNAIEHTEPSVSIRLNPAKWIDDANGNGDADNGGDAAIAIEGMIARGETTPVPWCRYGHYLSHRPPFTTDPLLHCGAYYVQEASSMFLWHVLQQHLGDEPVNALDLCAAPGGKSTLLLSALPEGSHLIANEPIHQRAMILRENIMKWGHSNVMVTSNYAEHFQPLGEVFNLIVCDAPCSGEGMFRKDADSIGEWSISNVHTCQQRQRDIIRDIWPTLADGGLFIYSTCTYNHLEDEDNAAWIVDEFDAEQLPLGDIPEWGISNGHFFPHKTRGEGFYIAVFRKGGSARTTKHNEKKLRKHLHILLDGIEPGVVVDKRKGTIEPSHSSAMATETMKAAREGKTAYLAVSITQEQALSYLRCEPLQLPPDTPRGYILLTYRSHPLGYVKNIGNRANNLYPNEWRIRKAIDR